MDDLPLIRDARPDDAAAIAAIYAPYVSDTPISFERDVPDAAEIARRMAAVQGDYAYLVAEVGGEIAAYAYAGSYRAREAYRHSVEVTAYASPAGQGAGLGAALYGALLERLASAGYHTALAIITLPNEKSVTFHERMGFTHVGTIREVGNKFGNWYDTGIWQRALTGPGNTEDPQR